MYIALRKFDLRFDCQSGAALHRRPYEGGLNLEAGRVKLAKETLDRIAVFQLDHTSFSARLAHVDCGGAHYLQYHNQYFQDTAIRWTGRG